MKDVRLERLDNLIEVLHNARVSLSLAKIDCYLYSPGVSLDEEDVFLDAWEHVNAAIELIEGLKK